MVVGTRVASEMETKGVLHSSHQKKQSVTNIAIISTSNSTLIDIVESHVAYCVTSIFQTLAILVWLCQLHNYFMRSGHYSPLSPLHPHYFTSLPSSSASASKPPFHPYQYTYSLTLPMPVQVINTQHMPTQLSYHSILFTYLSYPS